MAVRTQDCTKEYLTSVALPTHAESYTVISHEFIINHTMEQLALHGFSVEKETYRANSDGSIAQGVYYLNYTKDPEVGLMFAWSNSYNKLMRFKCAIGGYVFICMNGVVAGDMGSWGRKHLGSADTETVKAIIEQISNADIHFDRIVADKDIMKKITITERKQAELLGILYAEYEILTNEQMSIVKQQMDKPSYDYNCELNSLWAFYNHVTHALKKAHPRDWMDDQRKLHWFIAIEFDLVNFIEDGVLLPIDELELNYGEPENQLNILTEIEKAEEIEELTQLAEDREQAERDIVFYEDPAGNTFEAPVVPTFDQIIFEGLKAADDAKAEREKLEIKRMVSELKASAPEAFEKLENDLLKVEQELVFGDKLETMIEAEKEKTIDASDLIGEYTLDEMPEVIEKLQKEIDVVQEAVDVVKNFKDKRENESIVTLTEDELASQLYGVDNDPEYSAPVIEDEVEVEVEEVKPTETKIVDDWDDDDFNFDLDDTKKDDHGGEFFL